MDELKCMDYCVKNHPTAKYFQYNTESHPWQGVGTPVCKNGQDRRCYPHVNEDGKDYRNTCWCKEKAKKLVQNARHHFTGTLNCGGFYMGRLVKTTRHCKHDDPNEKCEYLWEGGDRVKEEVMEQGFTYDFEPVTSKTEFKCTYMEKDVGIL